uniref:Uncharacterized protein n=2 Tax=Arion vulgaris TaxID=1028688 RepID=A0A0B6Y7I2_9EUPU
MAEDDEVIGASVSIRDRDDLILIWNRYACFKDQSTVIAKLQELLPHVGFSTMFYKAFSMHEAFEGKKAHKGQS